MPETVPVTAVSPESQTLPPLLDIQSVSFKYKDKTAVSGVTFSLDDGEIGAIVGPSGCGKSTLMRGIAGFETPIHGSIAMNGSVISTPNGVVEPENRGVGMVFQDVTLFPHLDVAQNIKFGIRKWHPDSQLQRTKELLDLFSLSNFENRHPHSLSGGEQQRIALARAMAPRPKLLLMDESFQAWMSNTVINSCRRYGKF